MVFFFPGAPLVCHLWGPPSGEMFCKRGPRVCSTTALGSLAVCTVQPELPPIASSMDHPPFQTQLTYFTGWKPKWNYFSVLKGQMILHNQNGSSSLKPTVLATIKNLPFFFFLFNLGVLVQICLENNRFHPEHFKLAMVWVRPLY